ncbi:phosphotransferase [Mycolicibacterium sp. XJ870]
MISATVPVPGMIPSGIDEVTPAWLTDALPGPVTVTAVHAERIAEDSGFSSLLYRIHLTGSAGVPSSLIVKLPAESEARGAMELLGGYRRELEFYRHIAPVAPISTARCYVARIADGSADFVLVLEDLRDWDNADHLAGLSVDRARLCIDQLAALHAWSVRSADDAVLQAYPVLDNPIARELFLPVFAQAWQVYLDHTTQPVPPAVARFSGRFAELAPQALEALSERKMLLHGDIRADNMFFSGTELKIVDFQMAVIGSGVSDIAYLLSQGLPTEARRGKDEALVQEYLARLSERGVADYSFDEAWRHYRFGVAYQMILPVITLIGWDGLPERSRQLCLTLVDRAVATIDDINAIEVFA